MEVSVLQNSTGVDLLMSGVLRSARMTGMDWAQVVQYLYDTSKQTQLAWGIGDRTQGHLASLAGSTKVNLHQLLMFTLPGTPVFNYGDEIGLEDEVSLHGGLYTE